MCQIFYDDIYDSNFCLRYNLLIYPISYKKNYPHPYSNGSMKYFIMTFMIQTFVWGIICLFTLLVIRKITPIPPSPHIPAKHEILYTFRHLVIQVHLCLRYNLGEKNYFQFSLFQWCSTTLSISDVPNILLWHLWFKLLFEV